MRKAGSTIIAVLCLAVWTSGRAGATTASDQESSAPALEEKLATWLEREREARHIPGIGFALVRSGEMVAATGFGFSDLERGVPVTDGTVFRVGSVSKPITATAMLHLIENSDLALSTDLRGLLSDLRIEPPLAQPLTPHHLLTHTCGFNERLFGQHARSPEDFRALGDYLGDHLPPRFEEPGRVISYNDYCTSVAGYAVEKVSDQRFHAYVGENVFEPLGMTVSTFDQLTDQESPASGRPDTGK